MEILKKPLSRQKGGKERAGFFHILYLSHKPDDSGMQAYTYYHVALLRKEGSSVQISYELKIVTYGC